MIRIGYQGDVGSNSEAAAKRFASDIHLKKGNYELVPLIESRYVVSYLKSGDIDYGVVATRNSVAGAVIETYEAIKDEYFEFVRTIILPIHHNIYIKKDVPPEKIKAVTSHIQALNQTRKTRQRICPDWEEIESNDTALAARNLSEGVLPEHYAVICTKNAGKQYGLKLLYENIEDDKRNQTEFRAYKNPTMDYSEKNRPTFFQWLTYQFVSEQGMSYTHER